MNKEHEALDLWAIVELMGHQKIVGRLSEHTIAGAPMLRVDVPGRAGETAYTRFYSAAAIYAINPVDRQIAIGMAANLDARPVTVYDLARFAKDKQIGWPESGSEEEDKSSEGC